MNRKDVVIIAAFALAALLMPITIVLVGIYANQ